MKTGDVNTVNKSVFPFYEDRDCDGFQEVLQRYNEVTPTVQLCGPTNFGPIIRKAIEITEREQQYHILIIIADGEVTSISDTKNAIVEASYSPLSIICIGVGDGPFDLMKSFDDDIMDREFDNVSLFRTIII